MSGYHIGNNALRITKVLDVMTESPTVKTLTFRDKKCMTARPGQFLMLWIPYVDEIPLSILGTGKNDTVSVAVRNVGEATRALHERKIGDPVGIRGPLGNSFTIRGERVVMVSGGTGAAPLLFLAKKLSSTNTKSIFIQGTKTRSELLFMNELEGISKGGNLRLVTSTEDGSCGIAGLCTAPLEQILANKRFDMIYTCGPEPMMREVFDLAEKHRLRIEASLERLMRCAIGLCGSCVLGKYRVCRDGPVFTSERLNEVRDEFGVLRRDFHGRKTSIS